VKGVFVVITLLTDGLEPVEQVGVRGYNLRLELGIANRRRAVGGNLGTERVLLKIGSFVLRAWFFHRVSFRVFESS